MRNNLKSTAVHTEAITSGLEYGVTPYLEALLRGRSAADPLATQFLPNTQELQILAYESADPIGDQLHCPVQGVVHRYPDRVLLKVTHACAAYCRFCFRREMVGRKGVPLKGAALEVALGYIRAKAEIWEVILTGGDPLTLSSRRLGDVLERLAAIDHVEVLRIHTRVPIVAPDRVTDAYARALECSTPVYLAVHVNHPHELTESVALALKRLLAAGVTLLSQTVLLRGVNDDAAVLERLFRKLVRLKVRPYYLHHPDLAPGTSHFRVPIESGQAIMRSLRGRVSGLCQPTYVLDVPGGFGKVPAAPQYVGERLACGGRNVADYQGVLHRYPE
jgi:lysine 2,3-aminomutase